MRLVIISIVALSMLMIAMPSGSYNASAAIGEWHTAYPSANNGTYYKYVDYLTYGPYASTGAKIITDGLKIDMFSSSDSTFFEITVGDFTNEDYVYETGSYQTNAFPPPDAEILSVIIGAQFSSGFGRPECQMAFSVNNGSSWTESNTYYESASPPWALWNVTSLYAWDNETFNNATTLVRIEAAPTIYTHYYLDYLGFYVVWLYEGGWPFEEYEEETEPGVWDPQFDFVYDASGIVGILGLVGFVGVFAVPALGVYIYRNGQEGKLAIFVKMLVLFMFCLTLFMYAIAGD